MRRSAILVNTLIVLVTLALGLVAGEIFFRLTDGYRLDSISLVLRDGRSVTVTPSVLDYAKQDELESDFDLAWFKTDPPDYDRSAKFKLPDDWVKAVNDYKPTPGERAFVKDELKLLYNYNWLREACRTGAHSNVIEHYKKNPGFVYAFMNYDSSDQPGYRMAPSSWETGGNYYNNFGFRGPDIKPFKTADEIRLAFLGSSATANGWPFTWPEYATHYLQLWAQKSGLPVRFDVINAARGGIDAVAIDKIMRYEVAPLRPDIVVYYEGGNDLSAADILTRSSASTSSPSQVRTNLHLMYLPLEQESALMARVYELLFRNGGPEGEPWKPPHTLKYDLTQTHPDLDSPNLPFNLHDQVEDLRDIAATAHSIGAEFFLSSFVMLVRQGLQLDPERDRVIFQGLNAEFWPLTYQEIRESADFENNVYRELAESSHYPFIDVNKYFPQDPSLFADTVHYNSDSGFRLQGWIVAQLLSPYIWYEIRNRRLPRPAYSPNPKAIAWAKASPIKFNLSCLP